MENKTTKQMLTSRLKKPNSCPQPKHCKPAILKIFEPALLADVTSQSSVIYHYTECLYVSHVSSWRKSVSWIGTWKPEKEDAEKEKVELAGEEEEEDPFDTRIKKSGCADLHYALLVSLTFLHCSMDICTICTHMH